MGKKSAKKQRSARKPRSSIRASDDQYTEEEMELVLRYAKELRAHVIKGFLEENAIPRSGNKSELVDNIQNAIEEGKIRYSTVVQFLDRVAPWGPQQVYLLGEPRLDASPYLNRDTFEDHLKNHKASKPFRQSLPLILPEILTVSEIGHDGRKIRVVAVERRSGWERYSKRDRKDKDTEEGDTVMLRGYVKRVSRGLIVLEWDLINQVGILQISRMPSGSEYEDANDRFKAAISKWLDLSAFPFISLSKAISTLHKHEEEKSKAIRSHGIEYNSGQSRIAGYSATAEDSVIDDGAISSALSHVRKSGKGRRGNFYWLLDKLGEGYKGREVHVTLFAQTGRVTFPVDNDEEVVRYVLEDIRKSCS